MKLDFYYVLDVNNSGRYLVINAPHGRIRGNIDGLDWAHWSRTSLYLTEDGKIAVLGVAYADYIVDPSNLTMKALNGEVSSGGWTYLGAFDGGTNLKFIPANKQRESNPTAMHEEEPPPRVARRQSRHEWCRQEELKM